MKQLKYTIFFFGLLLTSQLLVASNNERYFSGVVVERAFSTNHSIYDSILNIRLENLETLGSHDRFWVLFNKLTSDFVYGKIELDSTFIKKYLNDKTLRTLLITTLKLDQSISLSFYERKQLEEIDNRKNMFYYLLAHFNLGRTFALKNELEKASSFFKHTVNSSYRTLKKILESRSLYELSNIYYAEGLLEKAYSFSQKALRKARKYNEKSWECVYLNKLGEIQLEIGNYIAAEEFFLDANALSTSLQLQRIKGASLSNLGEIYNQEKHYKKAISDLQVALGLLYNLNDDAEVAKAHLRLGTAYLNLNKYNLARDNLTLGLKIASELKNELTMAKFHHLLAKLYTTNDLFSKAEYHVNKAIVLKKKNNACLQLSKAYTDAAELYAKRKQFDKAFTFMQLQKKLTDSLQASETQRKIAELNSIFQNERKEFLILEQQKELEKKTNEQLLKDQELENKELRNRQLYILIIVIVLVFVIVFVYVGFRNKQHKLQQEHKALELQQTIFRSQMNPHFVFNAMSVIQSYIYENETDKSSHLLVNFSRLMRLILENSSKEFIPLDLELEILERYLKIQKIRFENRFDFEITTENITNSEGIGIPPMLMQPFIENAIEHGNLDQIENGLIKIKVALENELIVLTIQDNGIGINKTKEKKKDLQHKSMSMAITQERINLLNRTYDAKGFMQIEDLSETGSKGTKVRIKTVYQSNFLQE